MKKAVAFVLIAALLADVFASRAVLAMPDEDIIRNNCTTAQSTLSRIEKADAVARINRGHDYSEALGLMFAMNARLAANQIAAPELTTITAEFSSRFNDFRSHYDVYDDAMSNAITIKCDAQPIEFYTQLERTRTARAVVKTDVDSLNDNISVYYEKFDALMREIKP